MNFYRSFKRTKTTSTSHSASNALNIPQEKDSTEHLSQDILENTTEYVNEV